MRPITLSYQIIIDFLLAASNELDKIAVVVVGCVHVPCVCVCLQQEEISASGGQGSRSCPWHSFICLLELCIFPSPCRTVHTSLSTVARGCHSSDVEKQKNVHMERHWVPALEQSLKSPMLADPC